MSIVSSPAAASPSTAGDGSLANPTSCSPSAPCRTPSAVCSSTAWKPLSVEANSVSSATWSRLPRPPRSPNVCAWVQRPFAVYAKPPFGGPERVLAYLARYTHRTAIANSRLVAVDDDQVAFSYKDYRRGRRSRVMRFAPHEFIRRFLLHVLPDGFHRIRHYGFLAKGDRDETLARVRGLLQFQSTREPAAPREPKADEPAREPFAVCPDCGGLMRRIGNVAQCPAAPFRCDTS